MRITCIFLIFVSTVCLAQDDDCIFNNDIKGLTQEWIQETNTDLNFIWNESSESYIAELTNKEMIELKKGGCYHSGTMLTYRTSNNRAIDDKDYWRTKTLELSKNFNLNFFYDPLLTNELTEDYRSENMIIYSFPKDEYESRISDGVVVERDNDRTILELSYYIN